MASPGRRLGSVTGARASHLTPPAVRQSVITRSLHASIASLMERRDPASMTLYPNDKGNPPGKLADAEIHFADGVFAGLKLIGFAIWERKTGGRNVTFPARQYTVNGERRSFSLLRSIVDPDAQDRVRDLILAAYAEQEAAA
jgi:hypothetical protein